MKYLFKFDKTLQQMVPCNKETAEAFHYVQDDTIPPTVSHATDEGLVFTSRSALYEHYREHGFECTGGSHHTGKGVFDWRYKADPAEIREDVQRSLEQIKWGMAPISEKERELCQREERAWKSYESRQKILEKLRSR